MGQREREKQFESIIQRRNDERVAKLEEDRLLTERAAKELEEERNKLFNRKMKQKAAMSELAKEWHDDAKLHREGALRAKREEEKKKVVEYREMLERQERNNKPNIPEPRMGTFEQTIAAVRK